MFVEANSHALKSRGWLALGIMQDLTLKVSNGDVLDAVGGFMIDSILREDLLHLKIFILIVEQMCVLSASLLRGIKVFNHSIACNDCSFVKLLVDQHFQDGRVTYET